MTTMTMAAMTMLRVVMPRLRTVGDRARRKGARATRPYRVRQPFRRSLHGVFGALLASIVTASTPAAGAATSALVNLLTEPSAGSPRSQPAVPSAVCATRTSAQLWPSAAVT